MANRGTRRMFSRSSSWFGHFTSAVAVGTPSKEGVVGADTVVCYHSHCTTVAFVRGKCSERVRYCPDCNSYKFQGGWRTVEWMNICFRRRVP